MRAAVPEVPLDRDLDLLASAFDLDRLVLLLLPEELFNLSDDLFLEDEPLFLDLLLRLDRDPGDRAFRRSSLDKSDFRLSDNPSLRDPRATVKAKKVDIKSTPLNVKNAFAFSFCILSLPLVYCLDLWSKLVDAPLEVDPSHDVP